MSAADKITEKGKWNEGRHKVRRQLHFSLRCPHNGQYVPSLSRLAAWPGSWNCPPACDHVCCGLSWARAAQRCTEHQSSPVSFTVSPPAQQCRGSAHRSATPGANSPGQCWGRSLVCDPIPGLHTAEMEPTTHSWIGHEVPNSPRDGTNGGMRRETRTKPRCATWHGALPCFKEPGPALPAPHQSPAAAGAPGRGWSRRNGCPAASGA